MEKINEEWVFWYLSGTGWVEGAEVFEPCYRIRQARSADGVAWTADGSVAINYADPSVGGITRATVLDDGNQFQMWFCRRNAVG